VTVDKTIAPPAVPTTAAAGPPLPPSPPRPASRLASPPATTLTGAARWLTLAAVALGVSLIIMDATVVNVALPVVIQDLHLSSTQAEWMNAVYSLMFAALLLTLGRVGDLVGRRTLFAVGMVVFVLASVVAGFSQSGTALVAARLVQGAGAAAILRRPCPRSTPSSTAGSGRSPSPSGAPPSVAWPPSARSSAAG